MRALWPLTAAVALLAAGLVVLEGVATGITGGAFVYPLDDTYIQMAMAKNLAAHGTWGATADGFSNPASSIAWPTILAAFNIAGADFRLPLVLNILAGIALLGSARLVFSRHCDNRLGQFAMLATILVGVPLVAIVRLGMEHTLVCVVTLWMAVTGVRACERRDGLYRGPFPVALLAALTVAMRYDAAAVVVPLLALWARHRGWRFSITAALVAGALPAALSAMAWRSGWPLLPTPVLLKHRLATSDLASVDGMLQAAAGGFVALVNSPVLLVFVLAALVFLVLPREIDPAAPERRRLLVVFAMAAFIHVQFGRTGWQHRYESHLMALGAVALGVSLARYWNAATLIRDAGRLAAAATLAGVFVVALGHRGYFTAANQLNDFSAVIYQHHLGRFMREWHPHDTIVLTEVGTVAYFTDAPIIDAAGLLTPEFLPSWRFSRLDQDALRRLTAARGALISKVAIDGWRCAGGWQAPADEEYVDPFYAADSVAADQLAGELRDYANRSGAFRFVAAPDGCRW